MCYPKAECLPSPHRGKKRIVSYPGEGPVSLSRNQPCGRVGLLVIQMHHEHQRFLAPCLLMVSRGGGLIQL
jgi:hypothetical protein